MQGARPGCFSVASLLIECCCAGFLPIEKGQGIRWRPGWWYQEWPGRGILFLPVQVIQDLVYDALVFNARDDFDRASTAATDLDVDIEDAFQWCVTRR